MFTHRVHHIVPLFALLVIVGILSVISSAPHTGLASVGGGGGGGSVSTSTPTYEFLFEKAISDNKEPDGYTADQFSFHVTGTDVDTTVSLSAGTDTYASATALLPAGSYTVAEVGPDGFVYEDWTVQWSGHGCVNGNGSVFSTSMTVTDDVSGGANVCRADNQFRGEPAPVLGCTDPEAVNYDPAAEEDDGSCEYDNGGGGGGNDKGTLIIVKNVINDDNGTSTPDMFSFTLNGSATTTFDGSGTTTLSVDTGTYTVAEVAASGYDVSYNNCTDVEVTTDGTTVCTVTNDDTDDSNGGGHHDKTYKVYGYVWNDADENDEKNDSEGFREAGILITATNGTTTATTTTDSTGAYSFELPEGMWTLSQDKGDDWEYTFPNTEDRTHTITVPEEDGQEEEEDLQVSGLWGTVWGFLFPAAHAAEIEEYGPYNFGNVQHSGGGGGDSTSSGGGGGGSSSGGSGGVSPVAEVAGVQTEILPQGGAFAGGGGASGAPLSSLLLLVLSVLLGGIGVRLIGVKA